MNNITVLRNYDNGSKIQVGDSTWDPQERSIKYVYMDSRGRPARTSPEVPIRIFVDMIAEAIRHNELSTSNLSNLYTILNQVLQGEGGSFFP